MYSEFDQDSSEEHQRPPQRSHRRNRTNAFGPVPGTDRSNMYIIRPEGNGVYPGGVTSQNQYAFSSEVNNRNRDVPHPSSATRPMFTEESSSSSYYSLQPRPRVYTSSSDQLLANKNKLENNRERSKKGKEALKKSSRPNKQLCTSLMNGEHENDYNDLILRESSSVSTTSSGTSIEPGRRLGSVTSTTTTSGESGDDFRQLRRTVAPKIPLPVETEVNEINARLERIDATLAKISKRFNLHEDNIDELQERLCVHEYGTPGSFFTGFRFFISLLKCTLIPIIVVEVLNSVLFP